MGSFRDGAKSQALFLGLMAHITGQVFLLTILPPLGRQLGFADIQTGAILSASALLMIVSAPAWGYLSERIGRRVVLLIALTGAGFGPTAFSLIVGWRIDGTLSATLALGLFFVARALQTVIASGLQPAAQAYIADVTLAHQRTTGMGVIGAAYGLGAILGAALAGSIGGSPVFAFGLIALLIGLALVNMHFCLAEQQGFAVNAPPSPLSLPNIWPCLVVTLIAFASFSIVQQVIALRLVDALGFTTEDAIPSAGAALMITAISMVIMQGLVLRALTLPAEWLVSAGTLLAAVSMLLCSLAQIYIQILGICIVFGLALGCIIPGNLAVLSLRSNAGAQGKAAGVNMMAQGLGMAIGPITGAGLHQLSPQAPFFAAALLLFCAAGLFTFTWKASAGTKAVGDGPSPPSRAGPPAA